MRDRQVCFTDSFFDRLDSLLPAERRPDNDDMISRFQCDQN